MNRILAALLIGSCVSTAAAASALLPGSIDFNSHALWGKEVFFGLDDNGSTTGATRWYTGEETPAASIVKYSGLAAGCLKTVAGSEVHRTIAALSRDEERGPKPTGGVVIPQDGLYIDTRISMTVGTRVIVDATPLDSEKISCFLRTVEAEGSTEFVIHAGSAAGATDYVTDANVLPNVEFQLTFRAVPTPEGEIVFEVFADGAKVTSGETEAFPSLQKAADSDYALRLYSLGVSGVARVDKINFSKVDPRGDPDYDKDDVSMLRESAEITVAKYPRNGATLYDFPILVRVTESAIKGFRYDRAASNGGDIRFTDENGRLIPHEIDVWDPLGESLIWVKVPVFRYGARITMHWAIQKGTAAPVVNASDVWSDYAGVWHMGTQALTVFGDSSGHGLTAHAAVSPTQAASSKIGRAAEMVWDQGVTNLTVEAAYKRYLGENGNFTFTSWHIAPTIPDNRFGASSVFAFGTLEKLVNSPSGWGGGNPWGKAHLTYRAGNGVDSYVENRSIADVTKNWFHSAFVNEGGTNYIAYLNAAPLTGYVGQRSIVPNDNPLRLMTEGFCADEVRITGKIRSAEWIKAEYEQAQIRNYLTYGSGNVKGTDNYWLEEPYVEPNAVTTEDVETMEFFAGVSRYGTPFLQYFDAAGNQLSERPTTAGVYKAVAIVSPGVRDGLRVEMTFVIFEKRAYHEITGFDRVMLFNSDDSAQSPVTLQGYFDVDGATNRVWTHEGEAWTGQGRFVRPGTTHVYREPLTRRELWRFEHARIGNLFRSDDELEPGMNFLPWGGAARRFDDSEMPANAQRYAGTLIFQNTTDARATSPLYAEGVGTVYFDAVNANGGYRNAVKVQVCGEDAGGEWVDVPLDVFAITNGVWSESMSTNRAMEAVLAMEKAEGTTNWFYRVRATVNTNEAVRVRIVRSDSNWNADDEADGDGLVSIDNIIVSYPAMGIALEQFGAPDDPGNPYFQGWRSPFDIAFPAVEDLGKMHGQVKVRYITNNTNQLDSTFVGALTMKYRWRYLNQAIGDWRELPLHVSADDPTRFVTADTLDGDGLGDIEYTFAATVNAPFYEYWDYSGLPGWTWPDKYTERRGNVRISALEDGVYTPSHLSPALGTDYFIRLRAGKSDYEGFRVHIRTTDPDGVTKDEAVWMRLADDHIWRGFYPSPTNGVNTLLYKIEAMNRQLNAESDYQWSTNWYHGANKVSLPVSDVLEEGETWTRIPCDDIAGYLMFQFEDATHSLSVIHADYQNFNLWTDANLPDGDAYGHFIGTSADLTKTSGVARTARRYDDTFAGLKETQSENELFWAERFNVNDTNGMWTIEKPFTGNVSTPRAWTAGNGMWVCERYREFGGPTNSIALQMKGEGYGTLMFPQGCNPFPKGIESFSYSARIAQSYADIRSFSYYSADGARDIGNGTFVVPCAMTVTNRQGSVDFTGVGAVSALAHYRVAQGGYEARVERIRANKVQLGIYRRLPDGTATLLKQSAEFDYQGTGFAGGFDSSGQIAFGALFISCTNTASSVRITAGILSKGKAISNSKMFDGVNSYAKISYEDTSAGRFKNGTYGVGSKDCPAKFVRPMFSPAPVKWTADETTAETLAIEEQVCIRTDSDYGNWEIFNRLEKYAYQVSLRTYYGFEAPVPYQYLIVETSPHTKNQWTPIATNIVSSFAFENYVTPVFAADDTDIRLTTGSEYGSCDIVIDNAVVRQWRGENFDDGANTTYFYDIANGAPTNFVYTTAWISSRHEVLLSPMRTTVDQIDAHRPAGVRAPLMDGRSGRGLGLGYFSVAYHDADPRARLIVQAYTNDDVSVNVLRTISKSFEGWTDIETFNFADMTADERANGVISCYLGQHGVKGVMRVIIDPELVKEAHDPSFNPENDPDYGRVSIVMSSAKDNPDLDKGSWWGWNLRTTNDPMKWLLEDGTRNDTRVEGLAFALNNSIADDVRSDDIYDLHKPFLQTPILTTNCIGEISFKARKYDVNDPSPTVSIYGMKVYDPTAEDGKFTLLTNIVVDCVRYQQFSCQMPISEDYSAVRLAVTGVEGVVGDGSGDAGGPVPPSGHVERVLLDEVMVYEAIRARLGFCNTGAFRFHLDDDRRVPDVPSRNEQPLCEESWGIQTELYAAQLSEKIDLTDPAHAPKVYFSWYEGTEPWGYVNWAGNPNAKRAELARASDSTNLVFRSGIISAPAAVVPESRTPGTIIQYSLEVVYYMEGEDIPLTNVLSSADWEKPEWYEPVDCNAEYGRDGAFAAYNILDSVAPGWAWINELNIFGKYNEDSENSDINNQYIEIAAPMEADMTSWQLRLMVPQTEDNSVITNTIAVFGMDDLPGRKNGLLNNASNMVFHVVASKASKATLKREDGSLDGIWYFQNPDGSAFSPDGTIFEAQPFGVQLVRPTGIVEHEIVVLGTNVWGSAGILADLFNPTNVANYLNRHMRNAKFAYVGDDDGGERASLSVWDSRGEAFDFWDRTMIKTPGSINTYADGTPQIIDPVHPTPMGSSITITASLGGEGHLYQTCGEAVDSKATQLLIIPKGSLYGTNIFYRTDRWYEMKSITTNGVEVAYDSDGDLLWKVNVGRGMSNNFTVVASDMIRKDLQDYGVTDANRYKPAIMDWLSKGCDIYGTAWPESDDEIHLAQIMNLKGQIVKPMDITMMYWLDMCPTIAEQYLIAGFTGFVPELPRHPAGYDEPITNRQLSVYLAISNGMHCLKEAPYVIRGLEIGSNSHDYATNTIHWTNWTNANFNIKGILCNQLTRRDDPSNWAALRGFVFDAHSFYPAGHEREFQCDIEIGDPFVPYKGSYVPEWADWVKKYHERPNYFNKWDIDEAMRGFSIEVLRPENFYENE